MLELRGVRVRLRRPGRARGRVARLPARLVHRHRGPVRLGQDHAAPAPGRGPGADARRHRPPARPAHRLRAAGGDHQLVLPRHGGRVRADGALRRSSAAVAQPGRDRRGRPGARPARAGRPRPPAHPPALGRSAAAHVPRPGPAPAARPRAHGRADLRRRRPHTPRGPAPPGRAQRGRVGHGAHHPRPQRHRRPPATAGVPQPDRHRPGCAPGRAHTPRCWRRPSGPASTSWSTPGMPIVVDEPHGVVLPFRRPAS